MMKEAQLLHKSVFPVGLWWIHLNPCRFFRGGGQRGMLVLEDHFIQQTPQIIVGGNTASFYMILRKQEIIHNFQLRTRWSLYKLDSW